jgi:hypothetical protein
MKNAKQPSSRVWKVQASGVSLKVPLFARSHPEWPPTNPAAGKKNWRDVALFRRRIRMYDCRATQGKKQDMDETKDSLRTIFNAAAELEDAAERAACLDHACGGDAEMRQSIEKLLQAHSAACSFFGGGTEATVLLPVTEKPGDRIGRYKILQQIGEGGCGVVYMAEQEEPVRRRVALKVIKLGMDTKSVITRFEAERQALAMMDHPNIAKVLDGGATEAGRPYFVMELVRGIKITEYCDEAKLSTRERLDLFIKVCQAIQHAHQRASFTETSSPRTFWSPSTTAWPCRR